jgi:hypothetical protein
VDLSLPYSRIGPLRLRLGYGESTYAGVDDTVLAEALLRGRGGRVPGVHGDGHNPAWPRLLEAFGVMLVSMTEAVEEAIEEGTLDDLDMTVAALPERCPPGRRARPWENISVVTSERL